MNPLMLHQLIGDQEVQSLKLKIKEIVVHVGHLVPQVFWKDFSRLQQVNYQIYQNNNCWIVQHGLI